MSEPTTSRGYLTVAALSQRPSFTAVQVWYGSGSSGNPEDGVFQAQGTVGLPIQAISSVRICEGRPGNEFNGDAVFELQAVDWQADGNFLLTIGQWKRSNFFDTGERIGYRRNLGFVLTITYVS